MFLSILLYFLYLTRLNLKFYLAMASKLNAIVYIDTDLDPDLETTHGSRSSPIPKIVRRSTPLRYIPCTKCIGLGEVFMAQYGNCK